MSAQYRKSLYASVAVGALLVGTTGAIAATAETQNSTNEATVTNTANGLSGGGPNTISIGGDVGVGASGSVSASGAVSATSVVGINANFTNPSGGFGTISQSSTNTSAGTITNNGYINGTVGTKVGVGGALSIGAQGATASVSITGMSDGSGTEAVTFAPPAVGAINQGNTAVPVTTVSNAASVTNTGQISAAGFALSGGGASASISATGAQSSVSMAGIGTAPIGAVNGTTFSGTTIASGGTITQGPQNTGAVSNTVDNTTAASKGITVGDVSGNGASVSAGASGAVASVGITFIDVTSNNGTGTGWSASTLGNIDQTASNQGTGSGDSVKNVATTASSLGGISTASVSGSGASVRAGATGALSSVSILTAGSKSINGGNTIGTVTQHSYNGLTLTAGAGQNAQINNAANITVASITGPGASAGISATGAGSSFSVASISDVAAPGTTVVGTIQQTSTNIPLSTIVNSGTITVTGGVTGAGSSASIGGVGAGAYVSFVAIK